MRAAARSSTPRSSATRSACRVAAAAPHGFHRRRTARDDGRRRLLLGRGRRPAAAASTRPTTTNALGIAGSQAGGLLAFLATGAAPSSCTPASPRSPASSPPGSPPPAPPDPDTVFDGPARRVRRARRRRCRPAHGHRGPRRAVGDDPDRHQALARPASSHARARWPPLTTRWPGRRRRRRVRRVHAEVHPDRASVVCEPDRDLTRPASPYAAKFSLPWSVAALLLDGQVGVDTYDSAALARADVHGPRRPRHLGGRRRARASPPTPPGEVVARPRRRHARVTGHVDRSPGGGATRCRCPRRQATGNVGAARTRARRRRPRAPPTPPTSPTLLELAAAAADRSPAPRPQEAPA